MYNNEQSLVHRNLHKTILKLSLPGTISSVLQTLYQLIDVYWVGKLGASALAAVGGSSFILWAVYSLTAFSSNGITTLSAQNVGAGKTTKARYAAAQGMVISTATALLLSVIVFFTQDFLYGIMGFTHIVSHQAHRYMEIILIGILFSFWFTGLEAVFRGIGDTHTPMYILAVALTLNALLDPVLIFGWYGFPVLGISGAAWASVFAQFSAFLLSVVLLNKKKFIPKFERIGKRILELKLIWRILEIGAPIALGGFFFSLIYVGLTSIISLYGTNAIAAIGVCHRIEGIAWFACVGFSAAAATLVGQNIGANKINQAGKAAWWVTVYGGSTLLFVSAIYYFFPEQLMAIFTQNKAVQSIGVEYFKIIALFEVFLAFEVIMEGAFSGAGYTLPVMLVTVPVTALRIPLAWFLAVKLGMGINGIWWSIAGTTFLKGALNLILFWKGVWKKNLRPGGKSSQI